MHPSGHAQAYRYSSPHCITLTKLCSLVDDRWLRWYIHPWKCEPSFRCDLDIVIYWVLYRWGPHQAHDDIYFNKGLLRTHHPPQKWGPARAVLSLSMAVEKMQRPHSTDLPCDMWSDIYIRDSRSSRHIYVRTMVGAELCSQWSCS